MFQNCSFS